MVDVRRIITQPGNIRKAIHTKVIEAVQNKFPIEGNSLRATLSNVTIKTLDLPHGKQRDILLSRGNASEAVYGDITVQDKNTGQLVGELKKHRLLNIPWYTNRFTLLLDGNEYAVVNQMRTKSGVYTRKRGNDEIESSFNLSRGANFKLSMDPASGIFKISLLGASLPAFAVLKILGAGSTDIANVLGEELYKKNSQVTDSQMQRTRSTLYDKLVRFNMKLGDKATSGEQDTAIREYFSTTQMDPETTALTLGKAQTSVSALTILEAMRKILDVYKGQDDIDERDHLEFQKIYGVEDLLKEVLDKAPDITKRIQAKLNAFKPEDSAEARRKALQDAFSPVYFTKPVQHFITSSSLSRLPSQINPVEFMDTASLITRLGEGAITSERAVPFETRGVNYSYLGLIDPIAAPESFKVGIDMHCTYGAMKGSDNEFYKDVLNCRTGVKEAVRAIELHNKYLGFPDPLYNEDSRKPEDIVPAIYKGKLVKVPRRQLDYQIASPHDMATITTNTLPFANANQGNRLLMGDKHVQQALPLKDPENRLVKAKIGNTKSGGVLQALGSWVLPTSPANGVVQNIDEDYIYIKGDDGVTHKVDYENMLPLATKTFLNNTIKVHVGDKVTKDQTLAESNFSRNGELTMGRNLTVAYMPYQGYNHEDGVVLSESAAQKMTSIHADKVTLYLQKGVTTGKHKYAAAFPTNYTKAQLDRLDENGVAKKGSILEEGDPVILGMDNNAESRVNQVLGMLHRSLVHPYKDISEVYEGMHQAEVVGVQKTNSLITVVLKIEKPLHIGDKVAGSYGNKGVCSKILPDDQMPQDEAGEPVDAVFTSAGVISRINPGQILESALGKVAKKRGEPYEVENYSHPDYVAFVRDEMKKYKVKDKETLTDPATGKKIPNVFVGVQHCHKLFKTTDTNFAARGVEGPVDQDESPVGSGLAGPKALGGMEVNALLAHNARAFLQEGTSLRSSKNMEFWKAFQNGYIPNSPIEKKTFTRFVNILKQAGINVYRQGNDLVAAPLTDKDILECSSGEIPNGLTLEAKTMLPEKGGLFDTSLTGGLQGTRWTHVKLAEPLLNPVFADAAKSLLRLSTKDLRERFLEQGGAKLKEDLNSLNIASELRSAEKLLRDDKTTRGDFDDAVKRVKHLRSLKEQGLKAGDAYVLSVVPVTPPTVRPVAIGKTGTPMENDANKLYKELILQNNATKRLSAAGVDNTELRKEREALYTRLGEVTGMVAPSTPKLRKQGTKGALDFIAGDVPKEGYFQRKVIYGKMNLTGRATITPDVTLGLDEVGLPEKAAWEMYKPFIVRRMVQLGYSSMDAKESVDERSPTAKKILLDEMDNRPIVINRAPTLWRHGILAAKPLLRDGKNLQINSVWEKGLNADYDGDAMQIHVPISDEAVKDALNMLPSKQLFSDKKRGDILQAPTREPIIGLYKATENVGKASGTARVHKFATVDDAWKAYYAGSLKMTDYVEIGG